MNFQKVNEAIDNAIVYGVKGAALIAGLNAPSSAIGAALLNATAHTGHIVKKTVAITATGGAISGGLAGVMYNFFRPKPQPELLLNEQEQTNNNQVKYYLQLLALAGVQLSGGVVGHLVFNGEELSWEAILQTLCDLGIGTALEVGGVVTAKFFFSGCEKLYNHWFNAPHEGERASLNTGYYK